MNMLIKREKLKRDEELLAFRASHQLTKRMPENISNALRFWCYTVHFSIALHQPIRFATCTAMLAPSAHRHIFSHISRSQDVSNMWNCYSFNSMVNIFYAFFIIDPCILLNFICSYSNYFCKIVLLHSFITVWIRKHYNFEQ